MPEPEGASIDPSEQSVEPFSLMPYRDRVLTFISLASGAINPDDVEYADEHWPVRIGDVVVEQQKFDLEDTVPATTELKSGETELFERLEEDFALDIFFRAIENFKAAANVLGDALHWPLDHPSMEGLDQQLRSAFKDIGLMIANPGLSEWAATASTRDLIRHAYKRTREWQEADEV